MQLIYYEVDAVMGEGRHTRRNRIQHLNRLKKRDTLLKRLWFQSVILFYTAFTFSIPALFHLGKGRISFGDISPMRKVNVPGFAYRREGE